jgi:DNA polymerase-3 subunit alpha
LLSYQTGWLKTHEPASYMAAVLSADMDHTDKVVGLLYDCRKEVGTDNPAAARESVVV